MYGNDLNVVPVDDTTFAVKKELLSPKYYQMYPELIKSNQMEIENIKFVLMPADHIINEIDQLLEPHPLDDYNYPYDGGHYGNYPNKKPYAHQIFTARFLFNSYINPGRGCHVHNSMGTGKSLSSLWAIDYLLKSNLAKKVLIIAPKVVMRSAWLKEINNEMMWITTSIKQGVARKRITDAQIDIINHDGITAELNKYKTKVGQRTFFKFEEFKESYDLIVYDECTALKNASTDRWKAFNKWFEYLHNRQNTKLWLLTGTPVAQSPVDAYGLIKLITPDVVPHSIKQWKQATMYSVDKMGFKWVVQDGAVELCASKLQPSVRFELKDCTDLPEHQFIFIPVDKTKRQEMLFKEMSRDFVATLDKNTQVSVANGAAKLSKLLQLLGGCIYDEQRKTHIIDDADNKLEALKEIIDQLPEDQPVVVFCDFTHIQEYLLAKLTPVYKTVELINGSVSGEERSAICNRVLSKETKVVIAHTVTTALGVDFTSTNVLVYFTPTMRNELYLQSLDRIRRLSSIEKGFTTFLIYHLVADTIEQRIFEGLHDKSATQDKILQLVRSELLK